MASKFDYIQQIKNEKMKKLKNIILNYIIMILKMHI